MDAALNYAAIVQPSVLSYEPGSAVTYTFDYTCGRAGHDEPKVNFVIPDSGANLVELLLSLRSLRRLDY
jgi:hypothetical protein